jgi:hypothetical protein
MSGQPQIFHQILTPSATTSFSSLPDVVPDVVEKGAQAVASAPGGAGTGRGQLEEETKMQGTNFFLPQLSFVTITGPKQPNETTFNLDSPRLEQEIPTATIRDQWAFYRCLCMYIHGHLTLELQALSYEVLSQRTHGYTLAPRPNPAPA